MGQRLPALPARLERVREHVERWRLTRGKRGRMPERLWTAAVGLARIHGVNPIARELRLDYYSLKQRLVAADEGGATGDGEQATFVEVAMDDAIVREECRIEFASGDGARMTIRGSSVGELDLSGLVGTFLGRQR